MARTWPDLVGLELLVAVADHGSLSAAARATGIAQPNASRSLARLERRLDVNLVIRSTTGTRLTPAGLVVVDWARQVLRSCEALLDGAAALAREESSLSVSASQTVAEHLLPAWLTKLRLQRPEISVEVRVENSAEVVADVLGGGCAIGFVEGPKAPAGVHTRTVANDELILVVAPDHPWSRRRTPVTATEIADTPLTTREAGSGTRVSLDEAIRAGTGRSITSAQTLASNAAVRVSVAAGGPPAVLSRLAVEDALHRGQLLEVPLADLDLSRQLRAVWTGPRVLRGPAADLLSVALEHSGARPVRLSDRSSPEARR